MHEGNGLAAAQEPVFKITYIGFKRVAHLPPIPYHTIPYICILFVNHLLLGGRFFVPQSSLRMHDWLLLANQKAERTKVSVFTLWNTFCIIFSHLMLIKVHFLALFWLFDQWISPNGLKWPPRAPRGPHPPRQIRQFWVNGSEFSNSVKRRWKYTKFAIRIT